MPCRTVPPNVWRSRGPTAGPNQYVRLAADITFGAAFAVLLTGTITLDRVADLRILFSMCCVKTLATGSTFARLVVDGVTIATGCSSIAYSTIDMRQNHVFDHIAQGLAAGLHTVEVWVKRDSNGAQCFGLTNPIGLEFAEMLLEQRGG